MIDIIHSYLVNIMHLIGYMVNTVCIHAYDYMINMTHFQEYMIKFHTVIHLRGYMVNLIHLQ